MNPLSRNKVWSGGAAVLILWTMGVMQAQSPADKRPHFEVATIKPNAAGPPRVQTNPLVFLPSGRFTATDVTLVDVIVRVYPTRRIQMQGGPDWIDSDRFDIVAKTDDADEEVKPEQRKEMVQTLLEDRFKLKMHVEPKEMPVYALVVNGAPKLQPAKDDEAASATVNDRGQIILNRTTVTGIVNTLANILHEPVVDGTDIKGFFDVTLDPARFAKSGGAEGAPRYADTMDWSSSVVAAVQEQLGLKLEKRKATLDITIIDHAERPADP